MSAGRRRWARIATGSSAALLLLAVISLLQMSDEFIDSYDPEANNLVKLGPGESASFGIEESAIVSALRISDGETPDSDLRLLDDEGVEIIGRSPGLLDSNRIGADEMTIYSPVRVFESLGGNYTLQNQGDSDLWLVDDEMAVNKLFGNFWMYMFYIGCCVGSPVGLVGVILAIMVWTDKRKMPDQFVIIDNGSVILDNDKGEGSFVGGSEVAPRPFTVVENQSSETPQEDSDDETWKRWDEG